MECRLKNQVGLNDKTDEEIAEEKTDEAEIITMISKAEWFVIRKKKTCPSFECCRK